eukprot:CAMPEP_0195522858 /NCGR_PEP_ID=MMETSP0794_2-20130614/21434_1 /TAXON_ID=515487 /ORGANISM="Stephanopyxis turris, Strain CCMP 815" /LENGTH=322 /DNA_ID=CAMNT_0040652713 /DNA_START=87 /DNA_END=1055 /DNA_ORIENTATION=+
MVTTGMSTLSNNITENSNYSNSPPAQGEGVNTIASTQRRKDPKHLTPAQRAKQNRDRNREHARNTRLRKKAYIEELKKSISELMTQRDAVELEKMHVEKRKEEQREVRLRVIDEFLKLRGSNERCDARWNAILDQNFTLTLPVTSGHGNGPYERVLNAAEVMADVASVTAMLENVGTGTVEWTNSVMSGNKIHIVYECVKDRFVMDGCTGVVEWTAKTVGAIAQGCKAEISFKGTLQATFVSTTNKILSVEMLFDTATVVAQIKSLSPSTSPGELDLPSMTSINCTDVATAEDAAVLVDSLNLPHFLYGNSEAESMACLVDL